MEERNNECFVPFGPLVYRGNMGGEFLDFLHLHLDQVRLGQDAGDRLAGNIESQKDGNGFPSRDFVKHLKPHVVNYLKGNYEREIATDRNLKNGKHGEMFLDPDNHKIRFNLGKGPWVNFSQKYEFNPIHSHSGIISAVAMIDIPEEIEEERETNGFHSKAAGCLDFIHANQHATVNSKTGDLFLFPAYLWHLVYPYHSDVERITMSFNITEVRFDNMYLEGGQVNYH